MNFIKNISDDIIVIKGMTISPEGYFEILNEEILEWTEIKEMLRVGKIIIIDEDNQNSN